MNRNEKINMALEMGFPCVPTEAINSEEIKKQKEAEKELKDFIENGGQDKKD